MDRLSAAQVHDLLPAADTILLDVREPWELEVAQIEGTVNVPMGTVPGAVQSGELKPDGRDIVVICHHGVRSLQVAYYLESVGFARVVNMDGGIDAWSQNVDASVPRY